MALLIFDAMNIIRRIHAAAADPVCPLKVDDTIASSLASFKRALQTHRPTHGVAVFDHGGRTWRHELHEHYQASRSAMPSQLRDGVRAIKAQLQHIGLHCITIEGVEAGDVIATLTEKWCRVSADRVIILSTEKSILQLLSDKVCIFDHFNDSWRDANYAMQKFGVKPHQMGDLLALIGDAADNIPGVDKVGKKTAAQWLRINGNLERVIANADKVSGQVGVNLRKGIEQAQLSRLLVAFKTDFPLGLTWRMLLQSSGQP